MDENIAYGVKLYTRNFDSINKKLRSKESLEMIENLVLKCLYYTAARTHAEHDLTVYRGTKNFKEIDEVSFISTSLNDELAKTFAGPTCCLFKILVGRGEKIVSLVNNSYFGFEKEILLLPCSTFTLPDVGNKFEVVYHSPENIPDIVFTDKDNYLLNLIKNLTQSSSQKHIFQTFIDIADQDADYVIDLFMKENLISRLHLAGKFVVASKFSEIWKNEKLQRFKNLVRTATLNKGDDGLDVINNFLFVESLNLIQYYPQNIENLMNLTSLSLQELDLQKLNLSSNLNLITLKLILCQNVSFEELSKIINLKNLTIEKCRVDNDKMLNLRNLVELVLTFSTFSNTKLDINYDSLQELTCMHTNIKEIPDDVKKINGFNWF